jgi:hypothetical protein
LAAGGKLSSLSLTLWLDIVEEACGCGGWQELTRVPLLYIAPPANAARYTDLAVAVALKYECDFDATLSTPEAAAKFNAQVKEEVSSALGIRAGSVQVICHQRGSVVAEVALKKSNLPSGEGDCRSTAQLAQELVALAEDADSELRRMPLGKLVRGATVDGPIAERLCDLMARALMNGVAGALQTKVDKVRARHVEHCRNIIQRLLHSQMAAAFDCYSLRVREVKERRLACQRVIYRMLHTHLAAAFDGFCEAVEQLRAHRQLLLRAVSRWQVPAKNIAFGLWCKFVDSSKAAQQEEAHAKAKEMLLDALQEEGEQKENAIKHHQSLVAKETQRRMEICAKTVRRMFHIQLATAFDSLRDRVLQLKTRRATAKRTIQRMLKTQLAGAFDFFAESVAQLSEHRRVVQKIVARWRQPGLRVAFDAWCEGTAVAVQEMMDEATQLAHERLSQELVDATREHHERLESIKLKREAGLRGILLRIAHSRLAVVFDSFSDAVRVHRERKELCRRCVCRMLHAHLASAFDLFRQGVEELIRHRQLVMQAMSRWRRPAVSQAWDLWLDFCAGVREELAAAAEAKLKHELGEECQRLEKGLLASRERQKLTGQRVVARMSHVRLAAVFDGFVTCVVNSRDRKQLARKVVLRMQVPVRACVHACVHPEVGR